MVSTFDLVRNWPADIRKTLVVILTGWFRQTVCMTLTRLFIKHRVSIIVAFLTLFVIKSHLPTLTESKPGILFFVVVVVQRYGNFPLITEKYLVEIVCSKRFERDQWRRSLHISLYFVFHVKEPFFSRPENLVIIFTLRYPFATSIGSAFNKTSYS